MVAAVVVELAHGQEKGGCSSQGKSSVREVRSPRPKKSRLQGRYESIARQSAFCICRQCRSWAGQVFRD
jgi:hypothetical protein